MLFYNQVKREFSQASWKRGQTYYREERVKDVRLTGNLVAAKVQGSDEAAYQTAIVMARGTIFNSECSCPAHRLYESHCKHVAAVSIWVLERGSLLRAGVGDSDDGVSEVEQFLVLSDADKAVQDVRLRSLLRTNPQLKKGRFTLKQDGTGGIIEGRYEDEREFSIPITAQETAALREFSIREEEAAEPQQLIEAEPVAFVRGIFLNKALSAITIEPAVRYFDPGTHEQQVETFNHLTRQPEFRTWRTNLGGFLKLTTDVCPVLGTVEAAKVIHQGAAALEQLAKLLGGDKRANIVFHRALDVEIDPKPLKLVSLNIGKKADAHAKTRALTFEFKNNSAAFTSDELQQLAEQGRLSSQYVWKGNKLYKFETSLNQLNRFANRSGVLNEMDPKKLASPDGIAQLDDDSAHPLHPLAAFRLSLELGVENFTVDPDWTEFHVWRKTFEKKKTPVLTEVDYGFTLRDYQTNGLSWLWSLYHRGLSALLADDMGLGKTHQVLALLTSLYTKKNKPKAPTLVIAPTSVVAAWSQKMQKYDTRLKWHIFHGKARTLPEPGKVDLVLTTYGILQKEEVLRNREWHIVILDEAQAIKNASTISSRASRVLKSNFRVAMTGTPVENNSTDLWSIMEFLLPGYLGSLPRFKRLYGAGREAPNQTQAEALKRLVSPFLLRRTKAQVLKELPEKTEEIITCELTPTQRKAYRGWLASAEASDVRKSLEGGGKVDYASILALLTRLKQVCDHPKLPDLTGGRIKKASAMDPLESGKWEALQELIGEALGSQLKVVIFTQYLGMMDLIGESLKAQGIGYTDLRGDTPDRAERLDRFAADPDCRVFVCSLLAGGLGIDLTAASVCIHVDRWWNPAKENQATDRLHRIGQTRGVQVFKLQTPGTIEDRIAAIIESKMQLSGTLIEESPLGLKAFSRKELLDLLSDPANE